jgi:hypothetical protein
MRKYSIDHDTSLDESAEQIKSSWHRPKVLRIDIKRTLLGPSAGTDLGAHTPAST